MSRRNRYRIVTLGEDEAHWHGMRPPTEDEIANVVAHWDSELEPMDVPQTATDYLEIQVRHKRRGWKCIETVYLYDSLVPHVDAGSVVDTTACQRDTPAQ